MTTHCITCRHWQQLDKITGLCKAATPNTENPQREYRYRYEGERCLNHCPNGMHEPTFDWEKPKEKTPEQLEREERLAIEPEYRKSVQKLLQTYFEKHNDRPIRQVAAEIGLSAGIVYEWTAKRPPSIEMCEKVLKAIGGNNA